MVSSIWWGIVGLGAVQVAKVAPLLEGSWRYIGGGAIVFQAIKTYIFGKLIRTVEYPEGDMVSFIIRSNNIMNLKWAIVKRQPALFPGVEMVAADVKHVARWTPPHFSEPCLKNKDLKLIPDGGVVFWSRGPSIPRRNITLDVREKELIRTDAPIKFVMSLASKGADEAVRLSQGDTDLLIELLIEKDESLHTIYRNFHHQPSLFKYYALRYLQRKQAKKPSSPSSSPSSPSSPSS